MIFYELKLNDSVSLKRMLMGFIVLFFKLYSKVGYDILMKQVLANSLVWRMENVIFLLRSKDTFKNEKK